MNNEVTDVATSAEMQIVQCGDVSLWITLQTPRKLFCTQLEATN